MSDEGSAYGGEKTRICPSCRMTISVFATKCRFCAEEVGRPKDEVRRLSTIDLGGETIRHDAPSEDVTSAMEMFRLQEAAERERAESPPERKSWIGKRKRASAEEPVKKVSDGMPELDQYSQELAAISMQDSVIIGASVPRAAPVQRHWKERLIRVGGAVVLLVILLFVGVRGAGWLRTYLEERNRPPEVVFHNRAPAILERGGPPISALEAAMDALRHVHSGENRRIAEEALQGVARAVNGLLNSDPWDISKLAAAGALASRAATLYPNESSKGLMSEVERENAAYRMLLTGVDSVTEGAIFKLNKPGAPSVTVKRGDTIEDRFMVKGISGRSVRLSDARRKTKMGLQRIITYEVGDPVPH